MSKPLQDIQPETGDQETVSAPPMTFTELENKDYEMPSLDLLADPKHTGQQADKRIFMKMRESLNAHSKALA